MPFGFDGESFGHRKLSTVFPPVSKYEYAVVIEDDLELSLDAAQYFLAMTSVMAVDPTVFCVCAHADNAFHSSASQRNVKRAQESTRRSYLSLLLVRSPFLPLLFQHSRRRFFSSSMLTR